MLRLVLICAFGLGLVQCESAGTHPLAQETHLTAGKLGNSDESTSDEPRRYDAQANARVDVQLALDDAKAFNKLGLIVLGANWCHDSRALAAQFETPRFQTLIATHYKLVYVDVGQKTRNIDIAQAFGIDKIAGTPTVFVTNSDGEVLNLDTAPTWRNAASRTEAEIWAYFNGFATKDSE